MKRIIEILTLTLAMVLILGSISVFAFENGEPAVVPQSGYYEYWIVYSESGPATAYGNWSAGSSGWGPSTLSDTITKSVSNCYTGTLTVSFAAIEASVGVDLGWSDSISSTYSVDPPANEKWQLKYRDTFDKYFVTEQKIIHMDGQDYPQDIFQSVYPMEWQSFDWGWDVIEVI